MRARKFLIRIECLINDRGSPRDLARMKDDTAARGINIIIVPCTSLAGVTTYSGGRERLERCSHGVFDVIAGYITAPSGPDIESRTKVQR